MWATRTVRLCACGLAALWVCCCTTSVSLATPAEWSGNGHYYDSIDVTGLTWLQARDIAEASTCLGVHGYPATITSQGENDFITSILPITKRRSNASERFIRATAKTRMLPTNTPKHC